MGTGAQKPDMGYLGLKGLSSYKFRTLASIFTNRASVYPELQGQSNQIIKLKKIRYTWGLGLGKLEKKQNKKTILFHNKSQSKGNSPEAT